MEPAENDARTTIESRENGDSSFVGGSQENIGLYVEPTRKIAVAAIAAWRTVGDLPSAGSAVTGSTRSYLLSALPRLGVGLVHCLRVTTRSYLLPPRLLLKFESHSYNFSANLAVLQAPLFLKAES